MKKTFAEVTDIGGKRYLNMVNPEQFLYGDRSGFCKGGRMYIHIFSGWWQIFLNAPAAFCEKKQTAAEINIPTAA